MNRHVYAALATATIVALAGCSGSSADDPSADPPENSTATDAEEPSDESPIYLDSSADAEVRLQSFITAAADLYEVSEDCVSAAASTLGFRLGLANIGPVLYDATTTGDLSDERLTEIADAAAAC